MYSISRRNHYNAWLSQGRVPGEVLLRYGPEPGNNIPTQVNNFNTIKRPIISGFERARINEHNTHFNCNQQNEMSEILIVPSLLSSEYFSVCWIPRITKYEFVTELYLLTLPKFSLTHRIHRILAYRNYRLMKVNLLNLFNTPTKPATESRLIASIDLSVNRVLTQIALPRRIRDRTWLRNSTYLARGCNGSNTYQITEKDTRKINETRSIIWNGGGRLSYSDFHRQFFI